MTHKYAEEENDAQLDIKEAGSLAVILRKPAPSGTADQPIYGPDVAGDCHALQTRVSFKDIPQTLVGKQMRRFLVSTEGVDTAPTTADRFQLKTDGVLQDRPVEILNVDPLSPAGVPIFWKLLVGI